VHCKVLSGKKLGWNGIVEKMAADTYFEYEKQVSFFDTKNCKVFSQNYKKLYFESDEHQ